MYLNAFGQPIVVLQSLKAVFELLHKRANIPSDRPRYIVAHEVLCCTVTYSPPPCTRDLTIPSFGRVLVDVFSHR
jgi:hypothetical protein